MSSWKDILSAFSPNWQGDELADSSPAPNDNSEGEIIPLMQYQFIRVEGPDAEKFLQGQCTCDFRELNNEKFVVGAHCTHQGRMISSFTSAKVGENQILLRVHESIAESALAALKKYIVFSKAKATLDEDYFCLAIQGQLNTPDWKLPEEAEQVTTNDGLTLLQLEDNLVELWGNKQVLQSAITGLVDKLQLHPSSRWNLSLINRGVAEVRAETQEAFIPQMFNFHLINAVSFKKGCYTGQEIVARMQYKGKSKKHLYALSYAAGNELPEPGDEVIEIESNKSVGQVIVAYADNENTQVLAVLNESAREGSDRFSIKNCDVKITWGELPYAIN